MNNRIIPKEINLPMSVFNTGFNKAEHDNKDLYEFSYIEKKYIIRKREDGDFVLEVEK